MAPGNCACGEGQYYKDSKGKRICTAGCFWPRGPAHYTHPEYRARPSSVARWPWPRGPAHGIQPEYQAGPSSVAHDPADFAHRPPTRSSTPAPKKRQRICNAPFPSYRIPFKRDIEEKLYDILHADDSQLRHAWTKARLAVNQLARQDREVRVWALKIANCNDWPILRTHFINVHDTAGKYSISERVVEGSLRNLTGVDNEVLLGIMQVPTAAEAIVEAILRIEAENLDEFAFACSGGTHRSLALAHILISLAYKQGSLQPTSRRTDSACQNNGFTSVEDEPHART